MANNERVSDRRRIAGLRRLYDATESACIVRLLVLGCSICIEDYPLWMCRAGDTIVMRGGPFGYTSASDKSRAFIIAATSYDAASGELRVSPEARGPRLAGYEARRQNV